MVALLPFRDRYAYYGNGVRRHRLGLAGGRRRQPREPKRPVVCDSGDGSSMYSIQALWTAANQKLPLTFVIVNNGGYRIIKQRLLFHGNDNHVGMDFSDPPVDFTVWRNRWGWKRRR